MELMGSSRGGDSDRLGRFNRDTLKREAAPGSFLWNVDRVLNFRWRIIVLALL